MEIAIRKTQYGVRLLLHLPCVHILIHEVVTVRMIELRTLYYINICNIVLNCERSLRASYIKWSKVWAHFNRWRSFLIRFGHRRFPDWRYRCLLWQQALTVCVTAPTDWFQNSPRISIFPPDCLLSAPLSILESILEITANYLRQRGYVFHLVGRMVGLNKNSFPHNLDGEWISAQNRPHWLLVLIRIKGWILELFSPFL